MITRRRFLHNAALAAGWMLTGGRAGGAGGAGPSGRWFMPGEDERHERTWMAFGASADVWGRRWLPRVRRDLATIAGAISRFEPVSMLVREHEWDLARQLLGPSVDLVAAEMDDVWIRDTGPTFVVTRQGRKAAVDFNFNGWGGKQSCARDAGVASFVARRAGVEVIPTDLVLEGGGIEVDGRGTAIIAESCVLNDNRNPGLSRAECEDRLMPLLGLEKIIWLPGIRGRDITDGHTDFYARFARPGVVVAGYDADPASYDHAVTQRHLELLRAARDAEGRRLEVLVLEGPATVRKTCDTEACAAGYVGYYLCNGAVVMQEFGDARADRAAAAVVRKAFPGREIVQVNADAIAAGGGSVHCVTRQEPAV